MEVSGVAEAAVAVAAAVQVVAVTVAAAAVTVMMAAVASGGHSISRSSSSCSSVWHSTQRRCSAVGRAAQGVATGKRVGALMWLILAHRSKLET